MRPGFRPPERSHYAQRCKWVDTVSSQAATDPWAPLGPPQRHASQLSLGLPERDRCG